MLHRADPYLGGEEVLNTSEDTSSKILKGS